MALPQRTLNTRISSPILNTVETISNSTQNIHLPPHYPSVAFAHFISRTGAGIILFIAGIFLCDIFLNLHLFSETVSNIPTVSGFIACASAVLLSKKNTKFRLLGLVGIGIGLATIEYFFFMQNLFIPFSAGTLKVGVWFLLLGLSLLISITKIPHRYHFMQIIALLALSLSLFSFLELIYQYVSFTKTFPIIQNQLVTSFLFFLLAQSTILLKPGRGFMGLFLIDSQSSQLARISLFYFTLMPPLLGFLLIFGEKMNILDTHGRLALMVVGVTIVSIASTWINVRLLFPSEVEHFMMKDSLEKHNLSLELNATNLSTKIMELEEAKQEVTKKLNNQETLQDIMESS